MKRGDMVWLKEIDSTEKAVRELSYRKAIFLKAHDRYIEDIIVEINGREQWIFCSEYESIPAELVNEPIEVIKLYFAL